MRHPLKLLALDTSSPQGSLALVKQMSASDSLNLVAERSWAESSSHSDIITQETQLLLKCSSISIQELTAIALGLGPGSFTGIRVAVNFARSLGYALDLPIIGLNSLQVLAFNGLDFLNSQSQTQHILCLSNAFKNKLYLATYKLDTENPRHPLVETLTPRAVGAEELSSLLAESSYLCLGNGYDVYRDRFGEDIRHKLVRKTQLDDHPRASTLAQWAFAYGKSRPWKDIKALYIRASEPEEKLKNIVS